MSPLRLSPPPLQYFVNFASRVVTPEYSQLLDYIEMMLIPATRQ